MNRLKGKTIAITRPVERSSEAVEIVKREGGIPLVVPTLELQISSSESLEKLCEMSKKLDWLIFTSPTSIESLFRHCPQLSEQLSPECKIAVIGPRTGNYLEDHGLHPDLIPDDYTAEGLLESFEKINLQGKLVGIPRTKAARDVLPQGLEEKGAKIFIAEAYKSTIPQDKKKIYELIEKIMTNEVDAITFTSPLTVHNLFRLADKKQEHLTRSIKDNNIIIVAIGPVTGKALSEYGIKPITPQEYTVKAMLERLMDEMD